MGWVTEVHQKCAGGCGAERPLPSNELIIHNLHGPIRWWCQPCSVRAADEDTMEEIFAALENQPHLRAKLRKLLLEEE